MHIHTYTYWYYFSNNIHVHAHVRYKYVIKIRNYDFFAIYDTEVLEGQAITLTMIALSNIQS